MWVKKALIAGAALAGVMFGTAGEAKAANYACGVRYLPFSNTFGSEGYIFFSVYTGPDCTGTLVQAYALCTTGSTSNSCSSSARYERQGILAVFEALSRAAGDHQKISVYAYQCNGGSTTYNCAQYVQFDG